MIWKNEKNKMDYIDYFYVFYYKLRNGTLKRGVNERDKTKS